MPESQGIDLIHEAEEAAEDRIRASEDSARDIRRQTEVEVKKIMKDAEAKGKKAAEKRLNENEDKRAARERKFQKRIDRIIAQIQEASKDREPAAIQAAVEMIVGGE